MSEDDERDKLVRDFVRWYERRVERTPTVRVPRAPEVPTDVAAIAGYLERELAIRDVDDTGVHRIEVLHRAFQESARPKDSEAVRRHDSFVWWKRKTISLLFAVIGTLIATVAYLAHELMTTHGAPTPQPRQEERTR